MGASWTSKIKEAGNHVKEEIKEAQLKVVDTQRQTQVALQIAMVRDQIMWGAGLYTLLAAAAAANWARTKQPPKMFVPPLVVGGFVLSYMCDMAYGNKMLRVANEAQHIYEHERERLIPPAFAPFAMFWTAEIEERKKRPGSDRRVGF